MVASVVNAMCCCYEMNGWSLSILHFFHVNVTVTVTVNDDGNLLRQVEKIEQKEK